MTFITLAFRSPDERIWGTAAAAAGSYMSPAVHVNGFSAATRGVLGEGLIFYWLNTLQLLVHDIAHLSILTHPSPFFSILCV